MPTVREGEPSVQSRVITDIEDRIRLGISRYGTALQTFNGRDMLLDAYEEALDLAIYLKGALLERAQAAATVTELANAPHSSCSSALCNGGPECVHQ